MIHWPMSCLLGARTRSYPDAQTRIFWLVATSLCLSLYFAATPSLHSHAQGLSCPAGSSPINSTACAVCPVGTYYAWNATTLSMLVGVGYGGPDQQGISTALSADGTTMVVGGVLDHSQLGGAWVFTRLGGVWTAQGGILTAADAISTSEQGFAVALSATGDTLAVGGYNDNGDVGATFVYTRSGGVWSEQAKLIGTGSAPGAATQGIAVSLSADGSTLAVGGNEDSSFAGAAWVFTRSGSTWTQQQRLTESGSTGLANFVAASL